MQIQEQSSQFHNQGKFDVFIPVRLNTQNNQPKIISFEYQYENEFQKNSSSPHHIQDQKTAHTYDPLSFEFSSRLEQKIKIDESTQSPNSKQMNKKNHFQSQPTYDFDNNSQINNQNQNQIFQQNYKISTKSTYSNKNYFKGNHIGNFTPNNQQNNETYTNNIQELQSNNWEKANFQKSKFTINPNPSFISYQKDSEDQINKKQVKKYKTSIVKSNHGDENLKLTIGFDDLIDAQKIDLYLFYRTSFTFDNDTLLDHKYKLVDFLEKNNQYIQEQKHCFIQTDQIVEKQEIDSLKFNSTEFKLKLLQKTIEQSQNNYAFLEDQQIFFTNDQSAFTKYGLHMATLGGQQGQSQDILTLEIIYDINLKEKQISQIILQNLSQIINCEQKDIIIIKTQKPISHSNHLIFYITFETQVDYTEVIKNLNIQSMVETVQNRINAYKPIEINYKPSQKQLLISVQDLNDIESVYLKSRFPPDKRGGFQYFFPNGFLTMSFNMQDKYDDKDNSWLDLRQASRQYGIFYIGPCKFNQEEEKYKDHFLSFMKIKLQSSQSIEGQSSVKQEIEQYQLQRKVQQDYQYEECELGKGTIGRGIQITNDPHIALQYTKPFQICGQTYRTFFQVRCDPYLVKKCADSPFFIVNNPQDIRPFKLIIYQEK
ncbi:hypothetical protein PPERSA_01040 [Pseudocohnilembus persalinus]|uniref:Uncharacterized protein n=1 Tax=Pseudocohnilembus persalinus TaxID=266149 RepID=A0A0V0QV92_PSEPJ|nr:hypothetical protein PPERSA_01040 [Pseudocohnilembus persalinus]|eukprot:KRX05962.1 hypothetical protein PPERSA_01040 [Pseudocohnilembus persalinus]